MEEFKDRIDLVTIYQSNTTLFGERIHAAVQYVKSMPNVDPDKVALIGYVHFSSFVSFFALEKVFVSFFEISVSLLLFEIFVTAYLW